MLIRLTIVNPESEETLNIKKEAVRLLKKEKHALIRSDKVAAKIERDPVQVCRWLKGKAMSAMTANHIISKLGN